MCRRLRPLSQVLLLSPLLLSNRLVAQSVQLYRDRVGIVAIQRFPMGRVAVDFATGRLGALFPASGDTLRLHFIDNGANIASPELMLISPDSSRPGVTIIERGHAVRRGRPVSIGVEEVRFSSDDATLAGTLITPATSGPHPVVLLLPGAGRAPRGTQLSWGALLASRGIAALTYDKRGSGASTIPQPNNVERLSELLRDARAAIGFLRHRADIDPRRIGIVGQSQGAWLATMIAADDREIAAIAFTSGGGVSPSEQELYRRTRLVRDSLGSGEAAAAEELVRNYFRYLISGGADTAGIADLWRRNAGKRWLPWIAPASDPTAAPWPPARRAFAEDLALTLGDLHRRVHVPVLAILGDADPVFPAQVVADRLRAELPRGLDGQLTIIVVPGADHGLRTAAAEGDMPRWPSMYPDGLVDWLSRTLGRTPERGGTR